MNNAPYNYDYVNSQNATITPSTIHVQDSHITQYFVRYLLQKAISIFKWNLPETWDKDYFLYSLFTYGYIAVINTNKYGVIPQHCQLYGYDIFYRPTHAMIANPLFVGSTVQAKIGTQCTLIKLQPDYGSIMDLVNYYAGMLALSSETAVTNLINSKLAYIGFADGKAEAETIKKMLDGVISGEPAVIIDKRQKTQKDARNWEIFNMNLKQTYIVSELLSDMRKWTDMFLTDIGVGNANTDKKERMITAEVESNNEETATMADLWLEQLKQKCKETRELFGINITVDWRIKPKAQEEPKEVVDNE